MTAHQIFQQLNSDIEKSLTAILNVRTIDEIHISRKIPGYVYDQEKSTREYWIALGKYTFSADLSVLSYIINGYKVIVPERCESRDDLVSFYAAFKSNKDEVIAAFDKIIDKPNMVFIGYPKPITMEQYLNKVVGNIHEEALNLDYNYKKLLELKSAIAL